MNVRIVHIYQIIQLLMYIKIMKRDCRRMNGASQVRSEISHLFFSSFIAFVDKTNTSSSHERLKFGAFSAVDNLCHETIVFNWIHVTLARIMYDSLFHRVLNDCFFSIHSSSSSEVSWGRFLSQFAFSR